MTTTYWCELAWLGGDRATAAVALDVDDGSITAVRPGTAAAAGDVRLPGLTLPGLANAHSHAFHRALRGRTHRDTGSFWTWREQMYELAATLDPDRYHALARATFAEMALAGITSVGEFHYLHHQRGGTPYANPNAMGGALAAAAADAGVRLTLLDTCYLQGGIGIELDRVQARFSDGDALSWATRASAAAAELTGRRVRVGAAIHSVRAVEPAAMQAVAAWSAAHDVPLHAHVSEQPAENEQCREAYGCTPVELLARHGVLGERFSAVHATHVTDTDLTLLGRAGATACLCPTTERDLADGIAPARAMVDAGARLAVGSDSHAVIDLIEEARAIELDERLATHVRGHHDPASLLRAATDHGQRSLGWAEAGRIEVGALADLCTIALDSVRTAGASADDALPTIVFAATAADVRHVVVDGQTIVRDGAHVRLDVAAELDRVLRRT